MGFLNSSNLKIINWGNKSTFCSGSRQEVIDITLGSYGLLESIAGWEVPLEPSLSDHSHILFTLQSFMLVRLIRSPRGTNRGSFQEYLREKLERVLVMNMKDEARLGLAVHWVQQALITAYEDNCLLRPARKGRKSLRWTSELESLRRELRRLFNRCQADNSNSWELYRETQWKYRKEVQKASKTWRTFCSSVKLGYIGLYLGTLKSGWDLWWLLLESVRNPKGKPWISCLPLTSPTQLLWRGEQYPPLPAIPKAWTGRWLRGLLPIGEWGWWDIPGSTVKGTGGPYSLPGHDLSCLPGEWLCSCHVAPG